MGDRVRLSGMCPTDGTLARIVAIAERSSLLHALRRRRHQRRAPAGGQRDQLGIVVAAADPTPRSGFVDRCPPVAAYDAGIEPLLIVTKTDRSDPAAFRRLRALEAPWAAPGMAEEALGAAAAGAHDGLGGTFRGWSKSTLVNALVPDADRAIGRVNDVTGRGRHTSTSAIMLDLQPAAGRGHAGRAQLRLAHAARHVGVPGPGRAGSTAVRAAVATMSRVRAGRLVRASGAAPPERLASLRRFCVPRRGAELLTHQPNRRNR